MLPHLNAFGFHLVHIWVILGSHWVHIWVTFGARIARQACATNWASKEEMKINEFPDCRRFPKLFQRSAFRNDDPESFDLETVISPIWMSSWARTRRTTLVGQCPLERASIRAVSTWLRAARDQRRETLPGLFQQLRVIYDSTCQGRREEGGWRVNRGEVRGYFSAC